MDFWAGYVSGAAGILIGNPLDILKTRLQAGWQSTSQHKQVGVYNSDSKRFSAPLLRGAAAPVLTYGALNAVLFASYNRSLALLSSSGSPQAQHTFLAGCFAGLATFPISCPTELVKCRAQVLSTRLATTAETRSHAQNSWGVAREIWGSGGWRGVRRMYTGGVVTALRDAVGFWTYESLKAKFCHDDDSISNIALKVLVCGGIAGCATWSSIFPLDAIKTRVQTQAYIPSEVVGGGLKRGVVRVSQRPVGALEIAKAMYRSEGLGALFRGFGACNLRAFVVNAVQWAVYESAMDILSN
ncbi:MAG: hypothetical protein M1820_001630 [Bogoriella megaspora]|nr:MAG: hypothetical protein M1820_001630 [Bogoriella megaspora]